MREKTENILRTAAKFTSETTARNWRDGAGSPGKWSIVLGDCPYYLVVTNREASILVKAGYELA